MTTPPPSDPPPRATPSLRRVLTGYLRLRSPFNLCLDALLVVLASYLLGSFWRWAGPLVSHRPPDQYSAWWALDESARILYSMVYFAGIGMFIIACVRIIADRIGPARDH